MSLMQKSHRAVPSSVPIFPTVLSSTHVPALDGLRGAAVLMVVAMHNFAMPMGWIGVDVFFVLSGFLITRILLQSRESERYFVPFYARRALRILPAYFLILLVTFVTHPTTHAKIWWYAAYLSNFNWVTSEYEIPWLYHTWSLSIEEQFYLIWPFVVRKFPRKVLLSLCGLLLIGSMGVRAGASLTRGDEFLFTYSLFTRSDGIVAGAVFALLCVGGAPPGWLTQRLAISGLVVSATLLCALALFGELSFSGMGLPMAIVGVPSAVLFSSSLFWIAFTGHSAFPFLLLEHPILRHIGRISYGLYLYHVPITAFGRKFFHSQPLTPTYFLIGIVLTVLAYLCALVSWHCLEAPVNRLKSRFPAAPSV